MPMPVCRQGGEGKVPRVQSGKSSPFNKRLLSYLIHPRQKTGGIFGGEIKLSFAINYRAASLPCRQTD